MGDIRGRAAKVIAGVLGITEAEFADRGTAKIWTTESAGKDARAASLGGDSLDGVEIVMAIEEEFEIEVPDDDAEKDEFNSLDGLVAYLERRLA